MRLSHSALLVLPILLFTACGEASTDAIQAVKQLVSRKPADAAQKFVIGLSSRDRVMFASSLTDAASERLEKSGSFGFQFDLEEMKQSRIGKALIEKGFASVEVNSATQRGKQLMSVKLRLVEREWRAYGVGFGRGANERVVDLEASSTQVANARVRETQRVSAPLNHSGARSDRNAEVSDRFVAKERAAYNALRAISEEEFDKVWKIEGASNPGTARELLIKVMGSYGLRIEEGLNGRRFERDLDVNLEGMGVLEAIETICEACELIPVYPDQFDLSSDELPALRFVTGTRDLPVVFTGPFMVEIEDMLASSTDATGEFTLTVRAIGLAPAMLAANESMIQLISPLVVQDEEALNLLDEEGQVYFTNPQLMNDLFVDRTHYKLTGHRERLERIDAVQGSVLFRRPTGVHQGQFADQAARRGMDLELGAWRLSWKQKGLLNRFEVRSSGAEFQNVHVRFAPTSEAGRPLEIESFMAFAESDHLWADLDTPEVPATLAAKVYETKTMEFPFRFADVLFPLILDSSNE